MNRDLFVPLGFEKIGEVCVDSGQLMIIDPCYLNEWKHGDVFLSKDNTVEENVPPEKMNNYHEACVATCSKEMVGPVLNELGIAFSSAWGDGTYSVYAYKQSGRIVAVLVMMVEIDEDEDEDLWEEEDKEE